jgi:ABC-type antimicrobial peptide transport system permease subunit
MIVRQGFVIAAAGVAIGLVAALGLSRLMASVLYGVNPTDPLTYGSVATALLAVAIVASWIPAMRAAGVDPASALRAE